MNELADKVFDYLKDKGKVSGGTVRNDLQLNKSDWSKAKLELAEHGLVKLGRGRGGTIQLLTDEKPPEEKKVSQAERMAFAREEKQYISSQQKQINRVREKAEKFIKSKIGNDVDFWVEPRYPIDGSFIAYIKESKGKWATYGGTIPV